MQWFGSLGGQLSALWTSGCVHFAMYSSLAVGNKQVIAVLTNQFAEKFVLLVVYIALRAVVKRAHSTEDIRLIRL